MRLRRPFETVQLLGFRAALELFSAAAGSMLFAVGVSRYSAIGNVAKLGFLWVGLPVAFGKWGFREAVWVLALSQLANYLPHLWGLKRHFKPAARTEAICLAIFIGSAVVAALIARAVS